MHTHHSTRQKPAPHLRAQVAPGSAPAPPPPPSPRLRSRAGPSPGPAARAGAARLPAAPRAGLLPRGRQRIRTGAPPQGGHQPARLDARPPGRKRAGRARARSSRGGAPRRARAGGARGGPGLAEVRAPPAPPFGDAPVPLPRCLRRCGPAESGARSRAVWFGPEAGVLR